MNFDVFLHHARTNVLFVVRVSTYFSHQDSRDAKQVELARALFDGVDEDSTHYGTVASSATSLELDLRHDDDDVATAASDLMFTSDDVITSVLHSPTLMSSCYQELGDVFRESDAASSDAVRTSSAAAAGDQTSTHALHSQLYATLKENYFEADSLDNSPDKETLPVTLDASNSTS